MVATAAVAAACPEAVAEPARVAAGVWTVAAEAEWTVVAWAAAEITVAAVKGHVAAFAAAGLKVIAADKLIAAAVVVITAAIGMAAAVMATAAVAITTVADFMGTVSAPLYT